MATIRSSRDRRVPDKDVTYDDLAEQQDVNDRIAGEPIAGEPIVDENTYDADARTADEVLAREKDEYGGMKFGSAFFGWLTAAGTGILLTALVTALGAAVGLGTVDEAADAAAQDPETVGLVGAIALAVVLFVAYLAGGYVAGRMARFSGAKQGVAVWLWAVIIAALVAVVAALAGARFDILGTLDAFPRIPINEGNLTVIGIATSIVLALIALVGAVVGGMAGMRYHRRVDRVGLGG